MTTCIQFSAFFGSIYLVYEVKMWKLLTLLFVAAVFSADNPSQSTSDPNEEHEKQLAERYFQDYLKYTGLKLSCLKPFNGDVKPSDITFYVYSYPEEYSVYNGTLDDPTFPTTRLNTSLETEVYIHGWLQSNKNETFFYLPTYYAIRGRKVNFITVDWSKYSLNCDYFTLVNKIVPKVADYVHQMLQRVVDTDYDAKRIHLIGVDVGAHIAGLAGKYFTSPKLGRITGLSPMGIVYNTKPENERLAKGDAEFVDVVHTNMECFGMSKPIGDVDFLPNGGRMQPNSQLFQSDLRDVVSFQMARFYYFESIDYGYGGFVGKKCDSWSDFLAKKCTTNPSEVMGEDVSRNVEGTVYLMVNSQPPYSRGVLGDFYPDLQN